MTPSSEQYAQLAALFTTTVSSDARPLVELLLPAHMPVQGRLWLVPYAGREAGDGVSMLVRMYPNKLDVAAIGHGDFDLSDCRSMDDVMERIDVPIGHWIVQPSSDTDPTSLLQCNADCITVLSGADQAAVVGAYQLLKSLISVVQDEELPTVRLVIVGAEERAANDAASRIVHTAHHQLGIQVQVGHPLPAMGSSNYVISQVSFSRSSSVVELMRCIRNNVDREIVLPEPSTTETIQESVSVDQVDQAERDMWSIQTAQSEVKIAHVEQVDGVRVGEQDDGVKGKSQEEKPTTSYTSRTQEPTASIATNDEAQSTSFASYIDGLLEITPRCPDYEHVELAIDGNGCFHILAEAKYIRDVAIVAAWQTRHHTLIALACGGLRLDKDAPSVQHLFTDDAVAVADLHGSGVQLHLLTEVVVRGNKGMFCTPLN